MAESEENSTEMIAFGLIAMAGDARSKAFEALSLAKEGRFDEADAKMREANEAGLQAHNAQTQLLTKEAQGERTEVSVLLVHAQDHLMTSILAQELIAELIDVRKELAKKADR